MSNPHDPSFADSCKTWRQMYVELWCAIWKCELIEFEDQDNEIDVRHKEALKRVRDSLMNKGEKRDLKACVDCNHELPITAFRPLIGGGRGDLCQPCQLKRILHEQKASQYKTGEG
jgi:hypothetical protein